MIKVDCKKCGKELNKPGALVFATVAPDGFGCALSPKDHICAGCWPSLDHWLKNHHQKPIIDPHEPNVLIISPPDPHSIPCCRLLFYPRSFHYDLSAFINQ